MYALLLVAKIKLLLAINDNCMIYKLCVYIYIYIYMYIYIYIYIHTYTHMYLSLPISLSLYIYIYLCQTGFYNGIHFHRVVSRAAREPPAGRRSRLQRSTANLRTKIETASASYAARRSKYRLSRHSGHPRLHEPVRVPERQGSYTYIYIYIYVNNI